MKLSIRERLHNYVIINKDRQIKIAELMQNLGLTAKQAAQAMYKMTVDNENLHKIDRGVWIYKPKKPVKMTDSPLYRLYDLLMSGSYTEAEIAVELGIDESGVKKLFHRLPRELMCKPKTETYYTLK